MSTRIRTYKVPYGTKGNYQIHTTNAHLSKTQQVHIVNYARQAHYARLGGAGAGVVLPVSLPFTTGLLAGHTIVARSILRQQAGGHDVAVYRTKPSGKTRKVFKTRSARHFGRTAFSNTHRNTPPQLTRAQRQQMARRRRRVKGKFA